MPISEKTRKIIWGLSGNRCAFPGCNNELFLTVGESSALVGEECHICARNAGGPRFDPRLTEPEVNDYSNLILLCSVHHKLVDDNPDHYDVASLREMKANHEAVVRAALRGTADYDSLYYQSIIDYIDMMIDFNCWEEWTARLLTGVPTIDKKVLDGLEDVHAFLNSRVMLGTYQELDFAIQNFNAVLQDFHKVFLRHAKEKNGVYKVEKNLTTRVYDEDKYSEEVKSFDDNTHLIERLAFELTKAGNYLLDMMRKYVDPHYNLAVGKLLTGSIRAEYNGEKKYKGLDYIERINRNVNESDNQTRAINTILSNITTDDERVIALYVIKKKVRKITKDSIINWLHDNEIHDINIDNAFDLLATIGASTLSDDALLLDVSLFREITLNEDYVISDLEEAAERHTSLASDKFSKLIGDGVADTTLWLFIAYLIEERIVSLGDRWRFEYQIESIKLWENKNVLDSSLSDNYDSCLSLFINNDLAYASDFTSYGNPREYTLYPSLISYLTKQKDVLYEEIEIAKELHAADIPF